MMLKYKQLQVGGELVQWFVVPKFGVSINPNSKLKNYKLLHKVTPDLELLTIIRSSNQIFTELLYKQFRVGDEGQF